MRGLSPLDAVAAQSFVRITTGGCTGTRTHSCSSWPCLPKLQLSVWFSLDLSFQSFVSSWDADWRLLVCFGRTNRRAKNIDIGHGLFTQRCRGSALAFVESFAKLAIASPLLIFLPTLSLLPIIFFPVTSETFQQIWDRWTASEGAPHFQEQRCSVNGACAHYVMVSKFQWKPFWLAQRDPQNDWTATQNRVNYDVFAQAPSYLLKPASTLARSCRVWPTSWGRQQKACNGGSWEKTGQEPEKQKWCQERLSCRTWKKPEGSSKRKEGRCLHRPAAAFEWTSTSSMSSGSQFFPIFSLAVRFFYFEKKKVVHGERGIFA